jgi:glutaredoxin-related protein
MTTPKPLEDPFVAQIVREFKANPWCAMPLESSDGQLVGGLIIVRGEHEFGVLKAFLRSHCGEKSTELQNL